MTAAAATGRERDQPVPEVPCATVVIGRERFGKRGPPRRGGITDATGCSSLKSAVDSDRDPPREVSEVRSFALDFGWRSESASDDSPMTERSGGFPFREAGSTRPAPAVRAAEDCDGLVSSGTRSAAGEITRDEFSPGSPSGRSPQTPGSAEPATVRPAEVAVRPASETDSSLRRRLSQSCRSATTWLADWYR